MAVLIVAKRSKVCLSMQDLERCLYMKPELLICSTHKSSQTMKNGQKVTMVSFRLNLLYYSDLQLLN